MTVAERLEAKSVPEPNSGCFLWTAGCMTAGYGELRVDGQTKYAHRLAYELAKGPITPGMTIDHLCRVRSCINPLHLEMVPFAVNCARGQSIMARNARKTECCHGHAFTPENTRIVRGPRGLPGRACRTCYRLWRRSARARKAI